jgi:hypothetical protein
LFGSLLHHLLAVLEAVAMLSQNLVCERTGEATSGTVEIGVFDACRLAVTCHQVRKANLGTSCSSWKASRHDHVVAVAIASVETIPVAKAGQKDEMEVRVAK